MNSSSERVAVLGAGGTMGRPIARHIAQAGIEVRAWNRSLDKARPLAEHGVQIADSPTAAAADATILLTMLSDTDAVLEAATPALDGLAEGALWLQMSTIGEEGIERCAKLAAEHAVTLIDAPVLGTRQPAEDGKLVVLASGPENARERLAPLFEAIGQRTLWVGDPGAATRLKMVANSWVLTVTEGCAEIIALAQGLDIDPQLMFDAIEGGTLDLPYLRIKGQAILERDFEPMFRLALAAKDARLIEAAAESRGLDLPLLRAVSQRMTEAARQHGDADMSATYLASAPDGAASR